MIPLIWYTSKKKVMGAYVNRRTTMVMALIVGGAIVALNVALIYTSI
jgi:manganese transport protein